MQERAFSGDACARLRVIECGGQLRSFRVVRASLDPQSALSDGGEHDIGVNDLSDAAAHAKPIHTGNREDDGVELAGIKLLQARVHVAAQIHGFEIGAIVAKLRLAAQAAGAHARARGEAFQRGAFTRDQAIARILAARDRGELEPIWNFRGNVFHAVDGQIDRARQQRLFKLLDEDAF